MLNIIGSMSIINVIDVKSFVLFVVELRVFLANFHSTTTTIFHLIVNYYCERSKASFELLSAAALTTEKVNAPKYQLGNINKIFPSVLPSASCLTLKFSRQQRRCRSRPPRQSDVDDNKSVCCLSSQIFIHFSEEVLNAFSALHIYQKGFSLIVLRFLECADNELIHKITEGTSHLRGQTSKFHT